MAQYKMFLDDERFPADNSGDWVICRSVESAISCIRENGMPVFISFDNDLGNNCPEGYNLVQWIIEMDMESEEPTLNIPDDFSFYVHSQNPIAVDNIRALLDNYIKFKNNRE